MCLSRRLSHAAGDFEPIVTVPRKAFSEFMTGDRRDQFEFPRDRFGSEGGTALDRATPSVRASARRQLRAIQCDALVPSRTDSQYLTKIQSTVKLQSLKVLAANEGQ
jgi:hypothetical protein